MCKLLQVFHGSIAELTWAATTTEKYDNPWVGFMPWAALDPTQMKGCPETSVPLLQTILLLGVSTCVWT